MKNAARLLALSRSLKQSFLIEIAQAILVQSDFLLPLVIHVIKLFHAEKKNKTQLEACEKYLTTSDEVSSCNKLCWWIQSSRIDLRFSYFWCSLGSKDLCDSTLQIKQRLADNFEPIQHQSHSTSFNGKIHSRKSSGKLLFTFFTVNRRLENLFFPFASDHAISGVRLMPRRSILYTLYQSAKKKKIRRCFDVFVCLF